MKAITIKQPWVNLIVEGIKDIENRTWATKYRGRVLIHSAQKPVNYDSLGNILTRAQYDSLNRNFEPFTFLNCGVILGSVEIVDCVINHPSIWAEKTFDKVDTVCQNGCYGTNRCTHKCFNFNAKENDLIYNWVLANPIKFLEPIPVRGKLSFWDYPNILAEPEEENGDLFCHCQLPVKLENQVMSGDGLFVCRYCGEKWYR